MTAQVVLLASADAFDAKLLEEVITTAHFSVRLAKSGAELFQSLAEVRVDAIVLDVGLDEGNGLEILRKLQTEGAWDTPVLMIERSDTPESRDVGMALGAADYLSKPFRISEVGRRLRNHIKLTSRRVSQPPPLSSTPAPHVESVEQLAAIVEYEYVRAQRYAHDLSVVVVEVQSTSGTAPTAAPRLVETIASCLRGADQLHRLGADVFVLILPETGCSVHTTIAERIEQAIEGLDEEHFEVHIGGTCTGEADVQSAEALLRKALDAARKKAPGGR